MSLKIENIVSDKNDKVKKLLSRRDELYIFEGEKLVSDILKNNFKPSLMVINNDNYEKFIDFIPRETAVWLVSERVMKKISSLRSLPAVILIFDKLPVDSDIYKKKIIFAVDNIQDPGNLGSVFRCAAAFGIPSIALTGECVRLTNTKFLRTAQNSVFYISVKRFDSLKSFLTEVKRDKFNVYLTSSHRQEKKSDIEDIKLPAVVVIGNEGKGVEKGLLDKYPAISIDQTGLVESLNAGVSSCILMNRISAKLDLIKSGKQDL
ncbi:MAG: RNA methyltransferase [Acidobacteriota bacterium]